VIVHSRRFLDKEKRKYYWKTMHAFKDVDEAREWKMPEPVPWREAVMAGQWILTDDGQVTQVLGFSRLDKVRIVVETLIGKAWSGQKKPFVGIHPKLRKRKVGRKKKAKIMAAAYAAMLVSGVPVDYRALALIMFGSEQSIGWVKRALKMDEVQSMVREEVIRQMDDAGLGFDKIMAHYKDLIQSATEEKDLTNLRLTLDKMVELHDAMPAKKQMNLNVNKSGLVEQPPRGYLDKEDEDQTQDDMNRALARRSLEIAEEQTGEVIE
jgi:hypothetical protein